MSGAEVVDAVVIGAGPNGLVAANVLVDAGWDVVLLESQAETGGAVRSAEVTAPGYVSDMFSAFYPLAAASPVIRDLDLHHYGLNWVRAPDVVAHALDSGDAAVIRHRAEDTAAEMEDRAPGDGDAWMAMVAQWQRIRGPLLDALFTPFPPVWSSARLLRALGTKEAAEMVRMAVTPVRRLAEERFSGDGPGLLLTGNAMHSDVPPDAAGSALFGWLLVMLGQDVGFPVPRGGAGQLAEALTSRIQAGGGAVRTETEVTAVEVRAGRATGVRLRDGSRIRVRKAVLADVTAPSLYRSLLQPADLPPRFLHYLRNFQWDNATIKVNWALSTPVPWTAPQARGAGTVHLGVDRDGFVDMAADLSCGRIPERPFLLFGQMTTADPTRSPTGTESAWAYTHVPRGIDWTPELLNTHVERIERAVERVAPGFTQTQIGRMVQSPGGLQQWDANLDGGAINAGTSALHQQLFMRPTIGLGRPETPIRGLFLAGASAHPGGGVHGACGFNAARAALGSQGLRGLPQRALTRTAWGRLL